MNEYNLAAIRGLLRDAFTAQDLWRFCQERPIFQPILMHFPFNATPAQMIDAVIEYCRTQVLLDELTAEIQFVNPRQYERYHPLIFDSTKVPLQPSRIPHNLPPRTGFVGRDKEKARIHEALRSRYFLISIEGIGGIGKTSLALEVAYECLEARRSDDPPAGIVTFDSLVWATARDGELTLNALLDAVALTLGYPGVVQHPLDQKRFSVEKLLRDRPCLLLVDNFETVTDEGVCALLRLLPEPSKALITTREQKLGQVWSVPLKGLNETESLTLIRSEGCRLNLESIAQTDEEALLHLHRATGGAPLAIKWAVGQIKQRGQSLDTILAVLHEARGSIFEEIFARSWNLLSAEAREVLLVMPLFATSATRKAIEAASGVHHFALDDAIGQLVEMSLLDCADELAQTRYGLHPLTRAFATAKQSQQPSVALASGCQLANYISEAVSEYADERRKRSSAEFELELPNITATIRWCWAHECIQLGLEILLDARWMMIRTGQWNVLMDLAQEAVEIADEKTAAELKVRPIGWIYRHRGNLDVAEAQVQEALEVLEKASDQEALARAKRHLGRIAHAQGDLVRAKALVEESLTLLDTCGLQAESSQFKTDLASIELDQGNLDCAQEICSALLDNRERLPHVLGIMAGIARKRGDLEESERLGQSALAMHIETNRLDNVADYRFWLAETQIGLGKIDEARQNLLGALDVYRMLDMQSMIQKVETRLASLGS